MSAQGLPSVSQLWAGWRGAYVEQVTEDPPAAWAEGTLFEQLLARSDDEGYVVARGARCAAILNAYPYTNGHLMVLPNIAAAELADLDDDTHRELWEMVRDAVAALRSAYACGGVNVGLNLGRAAGAGVPAHLHVHCLPRWDGDTNFMTAVANTRVLPEALERSWEKLRAAWPTSG